MAVDGCNAAIFEKIAYVKKLVECETVFLAVFRVRRDDVELTKSTGEGNMAGIVEICSRELYDTVLCRIS